jgi:hypothetical protein
MVSGYHLQHLEKTLTHMLASLVDIIDDGQIIEKVDTTDLTPMLVYTRDVFYLMNNVSSMVNAKWYLGEPDAVITHSI